MRHDLLSFVFAPRSYSKPKRSAKEITSHSELIRHRDKIDDLAPPVHPLVRQDIPTGEVLSIREEEEARAAAPERSARLHKMLHPLSVRRHGEDPKVRYAEVGPLNSLPPRLLVADELAGKARLPEALPRYRHRASVGFEEEVGTAPVLWRSVELKPEDPIWLHA